MCFRRLNRELIIACLLTLGLSGCRSESKRPAQPTREVDARETKVKFKLTTDAFADGAAIPRKHSGEGEDVSPALTWDGAPVDTKEFALICEDPDAPTPEPWVHWVIYGIGPDVRALPEGIKSNEAELTAPVNARQGKNSWPSGVTIGYRGPMPPPGHGTHHYHFTLFALDKKLDLPPGATSKQLLDAMAGFVSAETKLVGTYERK